MMRTLLKVALISVLISLLQNSVAFGWELAGWYSSGWPRGVLADYGYGVITTGGTGRFSLGFNEKSSVGKYFFAEFSYVDFGVETGYQPLDPGFSEIGVDVATDYYLMISSSGVSLEKRFAGYRFYCSFFGGLSYYSALSRISGLYRPGSPVELFSESDGMTWHAGLGAGAKISIWSRRSSTAKHLLDEIFFDVKADYIRGGNTELLNWRSIRDEGGTVAFDNLQANVDLFQLSFGLSFVL